MNTKATPLTLYPYQEAAIERMKGMANVFLFDEMGLGKTIQALKHVKDNDLKPCLIIPPKTLAYNWLAELNKWYPEEAVVFFENTDQFLDAYIADKHRFFIIWHDVLARFERDELLAIMAQFQWESIIVDEAHVFRNPSTQRSDAILRFKHGKKIILTGTPIVNSAMDLYVLTRLVGIDMEEYEFEHNFTYTEYKNGKMVPTGFKNKNLFLEMVGGIWIRRTKSQVLKDLPPKIESVLLCPMEKDQRKLYQSIIEELVAELEDGTLMKIPNWILAIITRLRQVALDPRIIGGGSSSSKTATILELIRNANGKIVVYSNFEQYITLLDKELKVKHVRLTGKEDAKERAQNVKLFQEDPSIKVLLATMQTGGVGLNLTAADTVIIADEWWNRARMAQAIDRIHRIGQTNPVQAITLRCPESIDEHIAGIVEGKDATAKEIIKAIAEHGY